MRTSIEQEADISDDSYVSSDDSQDENIEDQVVTERAIRRQRRSELLEPSKRTSKRAPVLNANHDEEDDDDDDIATVQVKYEEDTHDTVQNAFQTPCPFSVNQEEEQEEEAPSKGLHQARGLDASGFFPMPETPCLARHSPFDRVTTTQQEHLDTKRKRRFSASSLGSAAFSERVCDKHRRFKSSAL